MKQLLMIVAAAVAISVIDPAAFSQAIPGPASRPATLPTTRPALAMKRVVYLLDASGTMLDSFDDARIELQSAIYELKPSQSFSIVMDGGGPTSPFLLISAASNANKIKSSEFLDKAFVRGENDVPTAMAVALKMSPDVIWWVSDGDVGKEASTVAKEVRRLNVKKIRINTVTKFARDDGQGKWLLWKIAAESGGVCLGNDGVPIVREPSTAPTPDPIPSPIKKGPSLLREP